MWYYESPIGTLYIKRQTNGSYGLEYDETVWEACPTPEAEADNVRAFCTNCSDWDSMEGSVNDYPNDLSEWSYLPDIH